MKPEINVITLAVADLERALSFYRDALGLTTTGIVGAQFKGDAAQPAGAVVMFKLNKGLVLALYPRSELAKDSKQAVGPSSPTEFSIGHIVTSKKSVDQMLEKAQAAGATITDSAHDRAWGIYSGYFKDLDGHLWEIIYSPPAQ